MIETSPEAVRLGGIGKQLAAQIEGITEIDTRVTILGHIVRGGSPTAYDRQLATHLGREAVHLVANRQFGRLVVLSGNQFKSISIEEAAGRIRNVPLDSPLIQSAHSLGISLGASDYQTQKDSGQESGDNTKRPEEISEGG
jgi:6-phosphofructokinase 1